MITLLVKGAPSVAENACTERGLEVTPYFVSGNGRETHLRVSGAQDDRVTETDLYLLVARWMNLPAECVTGKGFPDGTLLHFTID